MYIYIAALWYYIYQCINIQYNIVYNKYSTIMSINVCFYFAILYANYSQSAMTLTYQGRLYVHVADTMRAYLAVKV